MSTHDPADGPAPESLEVRVLRRLLPSMTDLLVIAVWFAVAALIGALVWWQVTPLAEYTRTTDNGTMDEQQLAVQIATDGWYFVVSALGGLISGLLLIVLRPRGPLLMVLGIAAGGALATFVMLQVGLFLGPSDPKDVLPTVAVGSKVPLQLDPASDGLRFVWSIAALVGALLALWGREVRQTRHAAAEAPPSP